MLIVETALVGALFLNAFRSFAALVTARWTQRLRRFVRCSVFVPVEQAFIF